MVNWPLSHWCGSMGEGSVTDSGFAPGGRPRAKLVEVAGHGDVQADHLTSSSATAYSGLVAVRAMRFGEARSCAEDRLLVLPRRANMRVTEGGQHGCASRRRLGSTAHPTGEKWGVRRQGGVGWRIVRRA